MTHDVAWLLAGEPSTGAYVGRLVVDGQRPLRYVIHDPDGDWQFLHGDESEEGDLVYSCLGDMVRTFPHVLPLHGLPQGWVAEWDGHRTEWVIFPDGPDE